MFRRIVLPLFAALAGLVVLAGTASAAPPASVSVGPVPLPSVPLEVCVGAKCVSTPSASSLRLDIGVKVAKPGLVLVPPTVLPVPCPGGALGTGVRVSGGSAGATLSGKITVGVNGGAPLVVPLDRTLSPTSPPLVVNACVG